MEYTLTSPCNECPFLQKYTEGFDMKRLLEFASGEFPCHKTAETVEDEETGCSEYKARKGSVHCAGALIFLEKRKAPHQMMRICERLGMYDHTKLDMEAEVR
jgi:hypothetical protein